MQTTWGRWKKERPESLVLSFRTGYERDYSGDPYRDFPLDRSLALVITVNWQTKIYPFSQLKKARSPIADEIAGKKITIVFDSREQSASARGASGDAVPSFVAFVADVRAFYPNAPIYRK